jgi:hypothetical protein
MNPDCPTMPPIAQSGWGGINGMKIYLSRADGGEHGEHERGQRGEAVGYRDEPG